MNFHWGWRIATVYTVFALGTLGFVVFAMTKDVDLVRSDYYEYSLAHDEHMSARGNAEALGNGMSMIASGETLTITIPSDQVSSARGTVSLYRASSTTSDKDLTLQVDATGTMKIPLSGLARGKWTVTCVWTANGTPYEVIKIIEVG